MASANQGRPARAAGNGVRARRRPAPRGPRRHLPILLTVLLVAVVVLAFVAVRWYITPPAATPASSAEAGTVTSALAAIPDSELEAIGRGTSAIELRAVSGVAPTGAGARPEVLYVGAEYCPYCAAERWSLAVALTRFGTLSGAGLTYSSATDVFPNTPTLSFQGSSYTSEAIGFVPVEIADRQGAPLDQLSADQQTLMQRYDGPPYFPSAGGIPFLYFGGRLVSSGTPYSPALLQGMDQQQVVRAFQDPSSPQARAMLGTANVLTAAICQITGQQPAAVCALPAIASIEASLPGSGG